MNEETDKLRETANFWRSKIDEAPLSASERAEFDRWMAADPDHGAAYAEAELLWKALGDIEYEPSLAASSAGNHSRGALSTVRRALARRPCRGIGLAGAATAALAASLFAALVVMPPANRPSAEDPSAIVPIAAVHETDRGEIETVALADGSVITLGAKSRVAVTMTGDRREARLEAGAAFFDVAHDPARPFVVRAGAARVRVTGTAFDLQRKGGALHVAVEEGEVAVSHPIVHARSSDGARAPARLASTVVLTAGEGVVASGRDGLGRSFEVRLEDIGAWRDGQLVFFRARLGEIVDDANRYAETPIEVAEDLRDLRMTLTVEAGDVSGLLEMLETAAPIKIEMRGGVQRIEKKD